MISQLEHWSGTMAPMAHSRGGVTVFCNVWDNFIRGGLAVWPPPELVQKLYESRQKRAFDDEALAAATQHLGSYCDLQSVHSEDAVTWNFFGPLVYGSQAARERFAAHLLRQLDMDGAISDGALFWLWRRVPHPDSLVSGGPEIDVGLLTANTLVLGEAKWQSKVGEGQGVLGDKTQIQLRQEFCQKFGPAWYPTVEHFAVLGIDKVGSMVSSQSTPLCRGQLHTRSISWCSLADGSGLDHAEEFLRQLDWRERNSRAP